jgi:hypothetical protein
MTVRSIASICSRIGFALLLPSLAAVLTVLAQAAVGQELFGLAGLACASCADPSNGIDTAGAVGGVFGAGTAAGGAAAGNGGTDGSSRRPNPGFSNPMRNPRLPGPEDDVGDATSPNQQLEIARDGATGRPGGTMIQVSRQIQKWVESWTGTDIIGTVPAGGRN